MNRKQFVGAIFGGVAALLIPKVTPASQETSEDYFPIPRPSFEWDGEGIEKEPNPFGLKPILKNETFSPKFRNQFPEYSQDVLRTGKEVEDIFRTSREKGYDLHTINWEGNKSDDNTNAQMKLDSLATDYAAAIISQIYKNPGKVVPVNGKDEDKPIRDIVADSMNLVGRILEYAGEKGPLPARMHLHQRDIVLAALHNRLCIPQNFKDVTMSELVYLNKNVNAEKLGRWGRYQCSTSDFWKLDGSLVCFDK